MAQGDDAAVIGTLEGEMPGRDVRALFERARGEAHRQLVAERGDPAPYRLA